METIYALCILYVVLIILFVLNDIVKTVVSQFKGGNYQWYTIKVLKEKRAWWKWVLAVSAFSMGVYCILTWWTAAEPEEEHDEKSVYSYTEESAHPDFELMDCPYCGENFPKNFQFTTYDGDPICPNCIRDEFDALLDGEILRCVICESYYFPSDSNGYGLCWDCSQEYLTGCSFCGQYTFTWYNEDGFSLCPECAGELYSDEGIQQAIETWLEG